MKQIENIQCHQKENKSEQALQMIGHVVAKSYGNKRSMQTILLLLFDNGEIL
jgi:hypothetical protein